MKQFIVCSGEVNLTNKPQFSMVYALKNRTDDVIKCSKLKWNHEPQAYQEAQLQLEG